MYTIGIAGGKQISMANYLTIIKTAKAKPTTRVPQSFRGWWSVDGYEIVQQFQAAVMDRCNRGLDVSEPKRGPAHRLMSRMLAGKIQRECKWCGQQFEPKNVNDWFCDRFCHSAYLNQ